VPSLEPLSYTYRNTNDEVIDTSSILGRPDPIEYHNHQLEKSAESENDKFENIVYSLFRLVSKDPISQLRYRVSISSWQKQITTAVNQIAMGLREFVRKLLNEHAKIPVIKANVDQLRQFAGLDNENQILNNPN
jgi:hypothetical protein